MASPDPRRAVVADLTQPVGGDLTVEAPFQPGGPRAPRATSFGGGNRFTADPGSIAFHKERGTDDRRLFAVSFNEQAGNHWFWLVAAERGETGWTAHGVAGGTDGPAGTRGKKPAKTEPWLNLCGQWGGARLYAGGQLYAGNARVGLVRLTLVDGTQLSDDGDADVALFVGHRGAQPFVVDIFDANGSLLSSHKAYYGPVTGLSR